MDDLTLSDLRNVVDTLSDEGYDWESGVFIKDFPETVDSDLITAPSTCQLDKGVH